MDAPGHRHRRAFALGTVALTVAFLSLAARNIANFRPVSDDDNWIMSASFKLATKGVFGSDLYAGLFNGERRYFFNLPTFHVAQAAVFAVAGAGHGPARWPSLAAALVVITTASWLATRWYGPLAGWLTALLLVIWRSNLGDLYPGLPLLGLARSGRYDGFAVALVWLSIAVVDRSVEQPRRGTAWLAGALAGAAALTQFFGVAALPIVAGGLLAATPTRRESAGLIPWVGLGFAIVTLPYVIYAAVNAGDWLGQNVTIRAAARVNVASPAFYVGNVLREPARYATVSASALVVLPVLAFLVYRLSHHKQRQDIMLAATLVVPALVLAMLDSTKAALYAVVMSPAICILIAMAVSGLVDWQRRTRSTVAHLIVAVTVLAALVMLSDGADGYRLDWEQSSATSRYVDVASRIRAVIPDAAPVFGPSRWWWALHDRPYRALHAIWWQWRLALDAGQQARFADYVASANARYLIINDDIRADVTWLPSAMQDEFWRFIKTSCRPAAAWRDETYRAIELYEVAAP